MIAIPAPMPGLSVRGRMPEPSSPMTICSSSSITLTPTWMLPCVASYACSTTFVAASVTASRAASICCGVAPASSAAAVTPLRISGTEAATAGKVASTMTPARLTTHPVFPAVTLANVDSRPRRPPSRVGAPEP